MTELSRFINLRLNEYMALRPRVLYFITHSKFLTTKGFNRCRPATHCDPDLRASSTIPRLFPRIPHPQPYLFHPTPHYLHRSSSSRVTFSPSLNLLYSYSSSSANGDKPSEGKASEAENKTSDEALVSREEEALDSGEEKVGVSNGDKPSEGKASEAENKASNEALVSGDESLDSAEEKAVDSGSGGKAGQSEGFLPLLRDKEITVDFNIETLKNRTVAVDTYNWLHKGARSLCSAALCKGGSTSKSVPISSYTFIIDFQGFLELG
ncbi:exonuclease 1-like protein [Corchorus olitorius]|uniref:Exonuclease 1-like protein n=1 Tax=Corchorus olitorius TaxID=93759 RepID=A0A1R3HU97_9ROSI|nr:exonuclease 1-like protein [Corchorus olitorius]